TRKKHAATIARACEALGRRRKCRQIAKDIFETAAFATASGANRTRKTRAAPATTPSFSRKHRPLTCGSGGVCAEPEISLSLLRSFVSAVSRFGEHAPNLIRAKPMRPFGARMEKHPLFARLRRSLQMIMDVGA